MIAPREKHDSPQVRSVRTQDLYLFMYLSIYLFIYIFIYIYIIYGCQPQKSGKTPKIDGL